MKIEKLQPTTSSFAIAIKQLKGTAQQLAELVLEHGTYEFEGFEWLQGNFEVFAKHLGVSTKTIQRYVQKPPFHYITRRTDEDGKHILLKLGNEPCETDFVHMLKAVWVRALLHFNGVAAKVWKTQTQNNKDQGLPVGQLLERAKKAEERLPELEKLKAGKRISYKVQPHEMGLLRECIKRLGDDAFDVIKCVALWEGWQKFMPSAKFEGRIEGRFYHWPTLGVIAANREYFARRFHAPSD